MTTFTKELDNELVLEVELDTGIRPGYVSGFSYTDDKGNTRNKFQTLKTVSSTGIKEAIAAIPEPELEEPVPEEPGV